MTANIHVANVMAIVLTVPLITVIDMDVGTMGILTRKAVNSVEILVVAEEIDKKGYLMVALF